MFNCGIDKVDPDYVILLSITRSYRTNKGKDVIRPGKKFSAFSGVYNNPNHLANNQHALTQSVIACVIMNVQ